MTQEKRLLNYLQQGKKITRLQALVELGIFELSSRELLRCKNKVIYLLKTELLLLINLVKNARLLNTVCKVNDYDQTVYVMSKNAGNQKGWLQGFMQKLC